MALDDGDSLAGVEVVGTRGVVQHDCQEKRHEIRKPRGAEWAHSRPLLQQARRVRVSDLCPTGPPSHTVCALNSDSSSAAADQVIDDHIVTLPKTVILTLDIGIRTEEVLDRGADQVIEDTATAARVRGVVRVVVGLRVGARQRRGEGAER